MREYLGSFVRGCFTARIALLYQLNEDASSEGSHKSKNGVRLTKSFDAKCFDDLK